MAVQAKIVGKAEGARATGGPGRGKRGVCRTLRFDRPPTAGRSRHKNPAAPARLLGAMASNAARPALLSQAGALVGGGGLAVGAVSEVPVGPAPDPDGDA
jgi:hypothetical protein